MKRGFLYIAMSLLIGLGFTACNKASLVGTWIQPAVDNGIAGERGFTLQKDGTVNTINMVNCEFTAWERVGDQLILKGTTGSSPKVFADTMWIDELTKEHLILKDFGNNTVTYQRKGEN